VSVLLLASAAMRAGGARRNQGPELPHAQPSASPVPANVAARLDALDDNRSKRGIGDPAAFVEADRDTVFRD
jgi:hypothetical protein